MAFDRLLSRDPITRLRLSRQLMGQASYLMFLAPGALAVHWGWVDGGWYGLVALLAIALLINGVFFVAIRSGFSRRFADPALLVPQIVVAIALAVVTLHAMRGEARSVMLMLFVAMFFFGLFGLSTLQFLRLALVAAGAYALLVLLEFHDRPLDTPAFRAEVLRMVALVMILVWLSFLGGYFARLRAKLAERKRDLQAALARVQELSERDELTGVRNRRFLLHALDAERARAERFGLPFSVAIIDIDHFKRFNDAYGHHVGDEVLRGFCDFVRAQARTLDLLARQDMDDAFGRYGGEEFLLLMPHTRLDGASLCVERIRTGVEAHGFATAAGELSATFSAGVAEYLPGESAAELLARADAALYAAKTAGRNRVAVA
ncbi:diguanylate cyclase [Lysobacter sp. N42]|uniref:GGDEF domain-containing protein n=1 Tax=Lysobacter sp. N42 TaxID=2545719 RepID=UPI00104C70AB|nr:diguanylate cyclase [Lysobacter sp. N42]TCZ87247.1 diguanylate cyclase [Lysobacter sp. N42]